MASILALIAFICFCIGILAFVILFLASIFLPTNPDDYW